MDMLCDYGCGNQAQHTLKNGKRCCSKRSNTCPAIRRKNSDGLRSAYVTGARRYTYNTDSNWRAGVYDEPADTWFTYGSKYSNERLKKRILDEKLKVWECERCHLTEWQGTYLQLQLDHIDGDNKNNVIDNLRFLCPNCHSQTDTYCQGGRVANKRVSDSQILNTLSKHKTIVGVLQEVGLNQSGANYYRVKKLKEQLERLARNS
jgi:Zn finger protein HypA/HybF involved in hydrogenase expression